jgi:hypothetical protein
LVDAFYFSQLSEYPLSSPNGKTKSKPGKPGPDGLTDKQRAFVTAYVGKAAGNASAAFVAAGYSTEDASHIPVKAWQLLQSKHIQDAIAWYAAQIALKPENAKTSLACIANANMNNFLEVDENGVSRLDFRRAVAVGAMGQIKKYKETNQVTKDGEVFVTREIEIHAPLPAIEIILKMNGLLNERVDHQIVITDEPDPIIKDPLLNKLANDYERRMASIAGRNGESSN